MKRGTQVRGMSLSTTGIRQTAVRYSIDKERSTFTVRAFATGLLAAFGHNPTIAIPDFEGEIVFNPETVEQSSLRLDIHAASLTVTDDIREKDRLEINRTMQEEVLESDSYPGIIYESPQLTASKIGEGQYWGTLNGELTLHGVKRSQPVPVRISVNGDVLHATGEFSVRQSDYDIRPVSAAAGTVKLEDELKLSFDIFGRKPTATER
jgi:polyisoprenoid-binding protein YceI